MNGHTRTMMLVAALAASVAQSAFAQDATMTPEEIRSAWVGKKLFVRAPSGAMFDFFLKPDGTAELVGTNVSDTGSWRLSDNGYCTTWSKLRAGKEACFTVVRQGSRMAVLNADKSPGGDVLRIVD